MTTKREVEDYISGYIDGIEMRLINDKDPVRVWVAGEATFEPRETLGDELRRWTDALMTVRMFGGDDE